MRALVCRSFAPLDQLAVEDLPDPVAGPDQVVIDAAEALADLEGRRVAGKVVLVP